jgi:hypothetical protein
VAGGQVDEAEPAQLVFGEEIEQGIHLRITGTALDDPATPFVTDHASPSQDVQVVGQSGAGQTGGSGELAHGHACITGLHQQAVESEAVLLGESPQAIQGVN